MRHCNWSADCSWDTYGDTVYSPAPHGTQFIPTSSVPRGHTVQPAVPLEVVPAGQGSHTCVIDAALPTRDMTYTLSIRARHRMCSIRRCEDLDSPQAPEAHHRPDSQASTPSRIPNASPGITYTCSHLFHLGRNQSGTVLQAPPTTSLKDPAGQASHTPLTRCWPTSHCSKQASEPSSNVSEPVGQASHVPLGKALKPSGHKVHTPFDGSIPDGTCHMTGSIEYVLTDRTWATRLNNFHFVNKDTRSRLVKSKINRFQLLNDRIMIIRRGSEIE